VESTFKGLTGGPAGDSKTGCWNWKIGTDH